MTRRTFWASLAAACALATTAASASPRDPANPYTPGHWKHREFEETVRRGTNAQELRRLIDASCDNSRALYVGRNWLAAQERGVQGQFGRVSSQQLTELRRAQAIVRQAEVARRTIGADLTRAGWRR